MSHQFHHDQVPKQIEAARAAFLADRGDAPNTLLVTEDFLDEINDDLVEAITDGTVAGLHVVVAEMGVPCIVAYVEPAALAAAQAG